MAFSEYASGHGTFRMAAATVLQAFLKAGRFEQHDRRDAADPQCCL